MELEQEKLDLIEKYIKNSKKFSNNEDLYEDFFNETCKCVLPVVDTFVSNKSFEPYLKKVTSTSILNVLKDAGRLKRSKNGYSAVKEISIDTKDFSQIEISYENFIVEQTPEDIIIQKDTLTKIVEQVYRLDKEEPEKQYLKIYQYRYLDDMTQNGIAQELGLSQSEVSKRLFKLMKKIKQTLV